MTRNVLRSIVVTAPPERAYAIWSDFESFPRFMGPVVRVQVDGHRLYWRAMFDGGAVEWEAAVVELTPSRRVAWHASGERQQNVVVTIRPIDEAQTEVTIGAEYRANSETHARRTVRFEEYLRAFKELVEEPSLGDWTIGGDQPPGESV
ncbi:MAG TPA: SRPBCC family protein [Tepidisphaeraceae bacterium]|jgi:uncharacterized membrane protein